MSRDSERQVESDDFRNFYIATRNIDKKILASIKKELKKAAEPALADVKKAVLATPSEAHHHLEGAPRPKVGFRASIAASLKIGFKATKKRSGVIIRVDSKKFAAISEAGGRTGKKVGKLPRYLEGAMRKTAWKHPVFGQNMDKPETWPVQKKHPFLRPTVEKHRPEFVKAMEVAVDHALKEIEKKKSI